MVVVVGILMVLLTMGVSLSNGTGRHARKVDTDKLLGLIEQARVAAITSRCFIVLGITKPEDDERYRVGLFKVDEWPDPSTTPIQLTGKLLNRWHHLNTGIALIGGDVDEIKNLLDEPETTLIYGGEKSLTVKIHVLAFHPHGGIHFPTGSGPVALRLVEGNYHRRKVISQKQGSTEQIAENKIKIGRITARAYPIN